jgi:hypothetical protein
LPPSQQKIAIAQYRKTSRITAASAYTEMISRTPTLAEWPYRMVRLACDRCPRRGQYRKESDVLIPDVRHLIAQCPRKNAPGAASGVFYADLRLPRRFGQMS